MFLKLDFFHFIVFDKKYINIIIKIKRSENILCVLTFYRSVLSFVCCMFTIVKRKKKNHLIEFNFFFYSLYSLYRLLPWPLQTAHSSSLKRAHIDKKKKKE